MTQMPATLQWNAAKAPEAVASRADLENALSRVSRENAGLPPLAFLTFADGAIAMIGLGRDESILILHEPRGADGLTREWISVGDAARKGHTDFYLLGEDHSAFEDRSLLSLEDAIRGIGELFETRQRPDWIRWEENDF